MANKIKIRRGLKVNLPTLSVGEQGLCTDTSEIFIGGSTGNIQLANKEYVDSQLAQKAEIIVTQGIPVSQRKEEAFYLIETDQSPITTVGNIKVSPMMGLKKE